MSMEMHQGQGEPNSMTTTSSSVYNDDEPLQQQPAHASRTGLLVVNAHCEYPAVPNEADHDGFAVMLHVKAPPLVSTAPLDLVAVLDVSASMAGAKLAQVKRAMGFAVDRLGPRDRLSVVAFSGDARRVIRLTRMTDDGKAAAKRAVDALVASGGSTSARAGLYEAAKVLLERRQQNDVTGVILVSDGHDSCAVPKFFLRDKLGLDRTPVHTFGLGSDDLDVAAMHNISEATNGTFSFVEDHAVIQDALAQCIGGLKSVTAKDACVEIETTMGVTEVTAIKSGGYENSSLGDEFNVDVGELYANEERRFLLFLNVPAEDDADSCHTSLIKVSCEYTDMASGQPVRVETAGDDDYIKILRPLEATEDMGRCVEVERELLRAAAAEDMALAREAAERGAYDEAARILDARRESLSRSAPALSGDALCTALVAELHDLSQRVSDERGYRRTGRACILASMSSHALQRGSSSAHFGCVSSSAFATPAMRKMEKLSERLRRQQEARPPPMQEDGSRTGIPPRSRLEARLASAVPRLSMLNRYRRLLLKR